MLASLDTTLYPRDQWHYLRLTVHGAFDVVDFSYVYNGWLQSVKAPILASPTLADLDGDGQPEILLTTYGSGGNAYGGGTIWVWRGDGSVFPGWPFEITTGPVPGGVAVGDVDDDGAPDVVAAGWGGIYALHADGTLMPGWPYSTYAYSPPTLVDLDGDGPLEIAIAGDLPALTRLASMCFAPTALAPPAGRSTSRAWARSRPPISTAISGPSLVAGTRGTDFGTFLTEPHAVYVWSGDDQCVLVGRKPPSAGWCRRP